jgi:hypothetical protein
VQFAIDAGDLALADYRRRIVEASIVAEFSETDDYRDPRTLQWREYALKTSVRYTNSECLRMRGIVGQAAEHSLGTT